MSSPPSMEGSVSKLEEVVALKKKYKVSAILLIATTLELYIASFPGSPPTCEGSTVHV